MPIYEYTCKGCGHGFEVLVRRESDVPGRCPECGSSRIQKGFSTFAVSANTGSTSGCDSCPSSNACEQAGSCESGTCPAMSGFGV